MSNPVRWKYQIGRMAGGLWEVHLRPWYQGGEALFCADNTEDCKNWIEAQEREQGYACNCVKNTSEEVHD